MIGINFDGKPLMSFFNMHVYEGLGWIADLISLIIFAGLATVLFKFASTKNK
jgi:hypothetical protein